MPEASSARVLVVGRPRTLGYLHRRLSVDDVVQNVIGMAAPRIYSVVGFSTQICVPVLRKSSGEVLWTRRYRSLTKLL
jgi:hypothetical protein